MTTYVRQSAEMGKASTVRDDVLALEVIAGAYSPIGAIPQRHDVLICPAFGIPAPVGGATQDNSNEENHINIEELTPLLGWAMSTLFNMLSRLPVRAAPSGHGKRSADRHPDRRAQLFEPRCFSGRQGL